MTGTLHAGRPSGDEKRHCARNRLHIYQVFCPLCTARHWFALPVDSGENSLRAEHRRWVEQMRRDCKDGKHAGVEKAGPPAPG